MIPEAKEEHLREVIYRDYRILYYVDDVSDEVLILTVLHASRPMGG